MHPSVYDKSRTVTPELEEVGWNRFDGRGHISGGVMTYCKRWMIRKTTHFT